MMDILSLSFTIYRASKIEYWAPSSANVTAARIVVDFGENIQIVSKHEMGAQFFHRTEVIVSLFRDCSSIMLS